MKITYTVVWSKFGKAKSILRGESELIFGGSAPPSAVVLKLNVVLYRVKVQYLLTGFDNV